MPVEYKDYYRILGVPRAASAEEIHKAFRRLARQYHPDVAKNKAVAEEKFKEINEAYEVLGDTEKRRRYDTLGADWKPGAEFRPPPGWSTHKTWRWGGREGAPGGFEFQFGGTGFSEFFEQLFGAMGGRRGPLDRRDDLSEAEFPQRGRDIEAEMLVSLEEAARGAIRPISLRLTRRCERCQGTGQGRNRRPCPACGGKGQITDIKQYRVGIPAGVRDGQRLRLAGRGQAGVGNGPPGDLFLIVRLAKHPDFRVEGSDLYVDVELAPWEAVLGANVSVPTLQGNVNIIIPAGSQNGQKLRLRERGLPSSEGGSGDLYAVLNIQVPKRLSERERALWEQLARESSFKPRE